MPGNETITIDFKHRLEYERSPGKFRMRDRQVTIVDNTIAKQDDIEVQGAGCSAFFLVATPIIGVLDRL